MLCMDAMLDEVFAEAVVHKPAPFFARTVGRALRLPVSAHVILGLRVRPFSFWHAFNLDLIQYHSDKVTEFSSLLLCARCCQLRFPQSVADRSPRWHNEWITFRFKSRFDRDPKFKSGQIARFIAYRKDYADCVPETQDASGESLKMPWYLYQTTLLQHIYPKLTEAQAWDSPIAASQWKIIAHMAAIGNKVDLITPEDRKDFVEMEAEDRAKITPFNAKTA